MNLIFQKLKKKYYKSSINYGKINNKTSYNNDNKDYFKYSFYSLFNINSKSNDSISRDEKYKKNRKKILQRFIENRNNQNDKNQNEKKKIIN